MKAQDIRDQFAQFFMRHSHEKISSSSLIPHNDNTLMFANAGMNQFKDYFTGKAKPLNARATTIQKCVRAGGKHNDLENVGYTARHHTFFEMLGNFSFGDYFKEDAIAYAWDLLTKEFKIPSEKLLVTIHHTDDEAFNIWRKKIGVPESKIFRKGDKDNFWEMGEYGPCGPCSEIFYDHGEKYKIPNFTPKAGQDLLDDDQRYVEIWNLVFMQYEKTPEGRFNLPKPSIDTGSGLERVAAALQGKYWNYDTDIFAPIIKAIEQLTGKSYLDPKCTSAMRIVADHIRACTMLITDGVIPSNEGRGYVLRRITRRAIRHLKDLQAPPASFYKLVPAVFETLAKEYPQNQANQALAEKLLKLEEEKFLETLELGLKYLNEAIKKDMVKNVIPGRSVFKLYDSFGFPVDLTEIILREKGISIDQAGFDAAMKERKEDSKKSWKAGQNVDNKVFFAIKEKHGQTSFTGYKETETSAKLLEVIDLQGQYGLVFDHTPFYGESGGQAGDSGTIKSGNQVLANIIDTQKPIPEVFLHIVDELGDIEVGKSYQLSIDLKKRRLTARNHSATHLLQAALTQVLGKHVKQAGSLVNPEKLRFDFTHPQALTEEELSKTEALVNEQIQAALNVNDQQMSIDQALKAGAIALFGEKYGDQVRVLKMGEFSTELCGGTHVTNTSDIGLFTITLETSLSTGVRRMEGVTSETAIARLKGRSNILTSIEKLTQSKDADTVSKVESIIESARAKQKEIDQLKDKLQSAQSEEIFANQIMIKDLPFCIAEAPQDADLKKFSDMYMSKHPNGILLIYTQKQNQVSILLRASKAAASVDCSKILKAGLAEIEGKGGGRADMAQGSGNNQNLSKLLALVERAVKETIK